MDYRLGQIEGNFSVGGAISFASIAEHARIARRRDQVA